MKAIISLILLVLASSTARGEYYCIIFAYDSKPVPMPCKSHVWGVFAEVKDGKVVKQTVISWEPDRISYIDLSRPGRHSLDSLDFAVKSGRRISMFGPYLIDKPFFEAAEAQGCQNGRYKFLDGMTRGDSQNCIHRLSDVAGKHRTGLYWGWWAAESVRNHFRSQGLIRDASGEEAILALDIYKYPITRRR